MLARHARERRCIIPVRGFYDVPRGRQAHHFERSDVPIFGLAGIWREFVGQKQFVLITVSPSNQLRDVCDRMPCLLAEEDMKIWLEGKYDDVIPKLCVPYVGTNLSMNPVTRDLEPILTTARQDSLF